MYIGRTMNVILNLKYFQMMSNFKKRKHFYGIGQLCLVFVYIVHVQCKAIKEMLHLKPDGLVVKSEDVKVLADVRQTLI